MSQLNAGDIATYYELELRRQPNQGWWRGDLRRTWKKTEHGEESSLEAVPKTRPDYGTFSCVKFSFK